MAVQIGAKKLAGFDRPLEMLVDCHRRVEHFLDVMLKVEEIYRGRSLDEDGRRALTAAREYFKNAAPKHTADEEESLFPRLKSNLAADSDVRRAIEHLQSDHQFADEVHERVDRLAALWLATKTPLPPDSAEQLRNDLVALRRHYADHIRWEEEQVFPTAGEALAPNDLSAVGREMHRRRNLDEPGK